MNVYIAQISEGSALWYCCFCFGHWNNQN